MTHDRPHPPSLCPRRLVVQPREVWQLLAAMLPHLVPPLGRSYSPALPGFVRFATICAKRAGARGSIPEVSTCAARYGRRSNRLVDECRALDEHLNRP